jgi:hypothetical protein
MALIVSFVNISGLAEISDYRVEVWINEKRIDGPFVVKGHKRNDGWQKLVKQFASEIELKKLK